jgi:hypothetical protein
VNNAISPLAIVVLPEPLVGAAIRKALFMLAKIQNILQSQAGKRIQSEK